MELRDHGYGRALRCRRWKTLQTKIVRASRSWTNLVPGPSTTIQLIDEPGAPEDSHLEAFVNFTARGCRDTTAHQFELRMPDLLN